jgi:hypothetical protein
LNGELAVVMDEVYRALDSNLPILAVAGMRTAFDTAVELLKIDSDLSFNRKLEELERRGFIGDTERRTLTHLVDAGNSAIHRGWRPDPDHLSAIRESLEIFLQRTFVADKRLAALQQQLPKKGNSKVPKALP